MYYKVGCVPIVEVGFVTAFIGSAGRALGVMRTDWLGLLRLSSLLQVLSLRVRSLLL